MSIWKTIFLPFVGISAGGISAAGGISIAGISKYEKRIMLLYYSDIYFYIIYFYTWNILKIIFREIYGNTYH